MQDGAPPHCALPLRAWLNDHFLLVSGLGVQDKQNYLLEVPILRTHVASFCTIGPKRKSLYQKQDHLMNWNGILAL
jgi:hypothetical protein